VLKEDALFANPHGNANKLALGGVLCVVDKHIRRARQAKRWARFGSKG
jgi:hypothetical protein